MENHVLYLLVAVQQPWSSMSQDILHLGYFLISVQPGKPEPGGADVNYVLKIGKVGNVQSRHD